LQIAGWDGEIETEVEEFHSLIFASCEVLRYANCEFQVSGFGRDEWPTDVWSLSSVVEDLPTILSALRQREPTSIDFASQSSEHSVRLVSQADVVTMTGVTCAKNWSPDPAAETVQAVLLEQMLLELGRTFAEVMARVHPELGSMEPLPQWRAGQV
jgi:hypothetical protein